MRRRQWVFPAAAPAYEHDVIDQAGNDASGRGICRTFCTLSIWAAALIGIYHHKSHSPISRSRNRRGNNREWNHPILRAQ